MKKLRELLFLILLFASVSSGYCFEDKVLAIVNNEVITKAELDSYINLIKLQIGNEGWQKYEMSEKKALENLIEDKLITQEAKKRNIEIAERLIDSKLESIKSGFSSEDEFSQFLRQQGLSLSELRELTKEQMLSDRLITIQVRSRIFVSPAEVTEYYRDHSEDFYSPEGVQLESIFVRTKDLADRIYADLKQGADFKQLQQQYSDKSNLGLIYREQLRKDLDDVIFSLGVGEFSNSTEISEGYYIFLIKEKLPPVKKDLVSVQEEIRWILQEKKFNEKLKEFVDKLKSDSYIVIKDVE